ncbi:MAG: hypothetical protein OXN84_07140, partial [Albidovulum sp.]|nr:hypothetical protein [Albidovulum sp.]
AWSAKENASAERQRGLALVKADGGEGCVPRGRIRRSRAERNKRGRALVLASEPPPAQQRPRPRASHLAVGGGGDALPLEILDDLALLLGTSDNGLFGDPRRNVHDNPSLPKILRLEGIGRARPDST